MWTFDINHKIYSNEMHRRIFIKEHEHFLEDDYEELGVVPPKRFRNRHYSFYVIHEAWDTPESQGNTGNWAHYNFVKYQDAAIFIAKLAIKLNSPAQNVFMEDLEWFASYITDDFKETKKTLARAEKEKARQAEQKKRQVEKKHVYSSP